MFLVPFILVFILYCALPAFSSEPEEIIFQPQTIDDEFYGDYGLRNFDINGDGKPDLLGLAWASGAVAWYENPSWKKRVIANLTGIVAADQGDVDGDGKMDLIVAHNLAIPPITKNDGIISWLRQPDDLDQPWERFQIAIIAGAHRVLYGQFFEGLFGALAFPIFDLGASSPLYNNTPSSITMYLRPPNPFTDQWKTIPIDDSLHIIHAAIHVYGMPEREKKISSRSFLPFLPPKGSIMIGSLEGITLMTFNSTTMEVTKTKIADGVPATPFSYYRGTSVIEIGTRGGDSFAYLATLGPWEGVRFLSPSSIMVYQGLEGRTIFEPPLNETTLTVLGPQGHTICVGDFNGDGNDDFVAGTRGPVRGLWAFLSQENGDFTFYPILPDSRPAASYLMCDDFNGDGLMDFAATGFQAFSVADDHFIKIYFNKGKAK